MAKTENSQFIIQKRDIQRSSDGLPHPSECEANLLFQNKAQFNGAVQCGKSANKRKFKDYSGKHVQSQRKNLNHQTTKSKLNQSHASVSSAQCFVGDDFREGKNYNDNRNGCGGDLSKRNVTKCNVVTSTPNLRLLGHHNRNKEARNQSITHVPLLTLNGISDAILKDPSLNIEGNVPSSQETRISSLRKLLHSSLNVDNGKAKRPESVHNNVSEINEHIENIYQPVEKIDGCQLVPSLLSSKEEAILEMNNTRSGSRHHRKRSIKAIECDANSIDRDEVKEKIAELARMPRIKSLDEILASLRIKIDKKGGENVIAGHPSFSSDNGDGTSNVDDFSNTGRTSNGVVYTNLKYLHSQVESHSESNDIKREHTNSSVNQSTHSTKRMKVLLSGEVSRKPKSAYGSTKTSPGCPQSNAEVSSSLNDTRRINLEDQERRRRDWMLIKKQQRELACKRQVNRTEDLKAVLQARSAYRKEIPTVVPSSPSNTLEIPCKSIGHDTDYSSFMSATNLSNCQWNSSPIVSKMSTFQKMGPLDDDDDDDVKKLSDEDHFIENKKSGGSKFGSVSELDSDVSESETSIDGEVKKILSQLPPLANRMISLTELEEYSSKKNTSEDVESLVFRMRDEHIEGVNGNVEEFGEINENFREWHETVTRATYGASLTILPYVIID